MVDARRPFFGKQLRLLRLAAGLTQEELAARAGLTAKAISKLERGERRHPYLHTVRLLSVALGLDAAAHAALVHTARLQEDPERTANGAVSGAAGPAKVGHFLGALPAEPVVGREVELAALNRVGEVVTAGTGGFLILAGEAGVGKTRLAQEAELRLVRHGFLVLTGRCYEPERAVPFFPFLEILAQAQDAAPEGLRADLPTRWPNLGWLLPDWPHPVPPPPSSGADELQRLLHSIRGFLDALSGTQPLAILVDDLHWADESSLRLLRHLARYTRDRRILLVGTYRDVEIRSDHSLALALAELRREGLIEQVGVPRFGPGETAKLIETQFGRAAPELVCWVYEQTDGNPFFIRELMRSLLDRGELTRLDDQWELRQGAELAVPTGVREVIAQRAARLTPTSRELLHLASVLGQTFDFETLLAMSASTDEGVEAGLEEAAATGLVRAIGGDVYAFEHALTQQALYAQLGERHRRRLHRAAGEALEGGRDRSRANFAAELARHFLIAGAPERALHWVLLAGDQAAGVFAHAEAERHYRQALRLAAELEDTRQLADAEAKLGTTLFRVARHDEALGMLEQAACRYEAMGLTEEIARATAVIGRAYQERGTPEEGRTRIRDLLERIGPDGELAVSAEAVARLFVSLAHVCMTAGRYAEQLVAAERAGELARRAGSTWIQAEAEGQRGKALEMLGRTQESLTAHDSAIALAEALGDLPTLAVNLASAASLLEEFGDFQRCLAYRQRYLAIAERIGDPHLMAHAHTIVGGIYRGLGRWEEDRAHTTRALEIFGAHSPSWRTAYAHLGMGAYQSNIGNPAEAKRHFTRALEIAETSGDRQAVYHALTGLAWTDIEQGSPAAARARLTEVISRFGLDELPSAWILNPLCTAYLQLDEVDEADRLVEAWLARARVTNGRFTLVAGLRLQGMIRGRQQRHAEAQQSFEESVALAHELPSPSDEGVSLYEWGTLHVSAGEMVLAREKLEAALAIFRRLGATLWCERIEATLAAINATPRLT